ncbi:MAG: phosphotransferase [Sedimentisphaerales bacterium]|nr:phosphotransferase [Sedimentisphaerales bacterium]
MAEFLHIRDFTRFRIKGWMIRLNPRFPQSIIEPPFRSEPGFDGARGPFTLVSVSRQARVQKGLIAFHGKTHTFYIKEFFHRSLWDAAKHLLRPSRAARSAAASLMLQKEGFFCPDIVAFAEKQFGPFHYSSVTLSTAVHAEDLYAHILQTADDSSAAVLSERRTMIRTLGQTIGKMHAAGIMHGDLRPRNMLVSQEENGWKVFFLDNERTQKWPYLPDFWRLKNLVQINMFPEGLTRTDRYRFFREYIQENPNLRQTSKQWAGRIMRQTRKRLAQKPYGKNVRL